MAREISAKIGIANGGVAATSYTMPMPSSYVAGDVLVHIASVSYTSEPTSATGGSVTWNKYVFSNNSYNAVVVFWCVAGSSNDTPPTVNLVTSRAWNYLSIALRGVNTTTPFQGYARADATSGYTIQSPAIASVTADTLAIHLALGYGSIGFAAPNDTIFRYLGKYDSSPAIIAAVASQAASGALDRDYWAVNKTTSTNIAAFVLAINNAATVETGAVITNIPDSPMKSGNFSGAAAQTLYGDTVTVRAPNYFAGITAIKSVGMDTVVANGYSYSAAEWQYGFGFASSKNMGGVAGWTGGWYELPATLDMTGKIVPISFNPQQIWYSSYVGGYGSIVVYRDSAGAWEAFTILSLEENPAPTPARTFDMVLAPDAMTPLDSGGGTIDWTDITHVGKFMHRVGTSTQNVIDFVNSLTPYHSSSPVVVTGRNATGLTVADIYQRLWANKQGHLTDKLQANVQTMFAVPIQFGNGADLTKIAFSGQSFAFIPYDSRWAVIPDGSLGVTFYPSASDDFDLRSSTFVTTTRQDFAWHSSSNTGASVEVAGMSLIGPWEVTWKTGIACELIAANGCYSFDGKAQKLDTCTLLACAATSGAYLWLDGGADVDHKSGAVSSSFTKGSETYAIELRTAGFYDFTDTTFTGYTNELYISGPAGTYTITLAVGQPQPDVYNPNSRTIVWDVPTVDVTFGSMAAGSQLIVFEQGTTTEILNVASSGTSEVWAEASGAYDYTIMKAGMLPVRGSGASPTASITIDPQQKVDRAYVTSSGLVMTGDTPNCSANTGTKKFGLTADSTLQNFYSYMIEQWISNTALRNQDFPIVPNGPNSFRFIDWTWDNDTSIGHLSRDGMQYYDSGTDAVTDVWAAILSVGVPPGFQVRYQQQDGIDTTNAQATGNIDQLVKIKKTGTGAFDYTGWLVLKCQEEGYDQAEAIAADIYGTLEDQLYVFGLTPIPNGIAAGAADATVTVTAEPTPVEWPAASGKYFSTTIEDTDDSHSGLEIMQAVRAENQFNWSDLVRPNGDKFKTVTGNFYGDAFATPAGVRVVKADGVTPHPGFNLFNDDSGSDPYTPPVTAPITWAGAEDGTTVLLYNDSNAGALIDTQTGVTGGYTWDITLPHADVAAGDSLRLRFGHKEYYAGELQGTMTANGLAFVGSMTLHPVYAAWALNGEIYDQGYTPPGPYTMDGVNLQVDIAVGATTGLKTQLGAWTQYLMTLPAGLDAFYGAWDLLAINQIRQNVAVVDVKIDVPTAGALFSFTDNDVNYYRSDFTFPGNVEAGHGLIAMTYNASIFVPDPIVISGESVVTGTAAEIIAAIPSASTNASATRSELAVELADVVRARKLLNNKRVVDPDTGLLTVYDDDGTTVLGSGLTYLDAAGTQPYDGSAPVHRTEAVE